MKRLAVLLLTFILASLSLHAAYSTGSTVSFGHDTDGSDLEWLVLRVEDDRVLIFSKEIILQKSYNRRYASVTWETCTLRAYLNSEEEDGFLSIYFTAEERARIVTTEVSTDGEVTEDRVYIMSVDDCNKYLYYRQNRIMEYGGTGSYWWLRSGGISSHFTSYVALDGKINARGRVNFSKGGIRPLMWITLPVESGE